MGASGSMQSGGGFSGVFLSNAGGIVQSNAIVIAGGGGAGAQGGNGGGGGYPNGLATIGDLAGMNAGGGTQIAGGTGSNIGGPLQGASGGGFYGQGAGGGWYGGGAQSDTGGGRPAGGGSSYIGNINGATGGLGLTSSAVTENGKTWQNPMAYPVIPGGYTSNFYYGLAGQTKQSGLVVIVPTVGTAATQIGVSAALYSG